jgi:hypothetical protein
MADPLVTKIGHGLQIWKVAADMQNKQLQAADRGRPEYHEISTPTPPTHHTHTHTHTHFIFYSVKQCNFTSHFSILLTLFIHENLKETHSLETPAVV